MLVRRKCTLVSDFCISFWWCHTLRITIKLWNLSMLDSGKKSCVTFLVKHKLKKNYLHFSILWWIQSTKERKESKKNRRGLKQVDRSIHFFSRLLDHSSSQAEMLQQPISKKKDTSIIFLDQRGNGTSWLETRPRMSSHFNASKLYLCIVLAYFASIILLHPYDTYCKITKVPPSPRKLWTIMTRWWRVATSRF